MDVQKHIIQCIGLNHKTASISLREQLAFPPHRLESSLARIGCGSQAADKFIHELVILSTCNRVELYAVTNQPDFGVLEDFFSDVQDVVISEDSPDGLYRLENGSAVTHLLRVAAGLDSAVLGETQILGQVADAYTKAQENCTAGKVLSRLFQTAIRAGKRARSETAISHKPSSVASVAVNLISKSVPDLSNAKVMVLGAGDMAELAVEALRKRGTDRVIVVNRTKQRAQELASRWKGQAFALEMLLGCLQDSDIVITSTGAPHTIIQYSMVENAMSDRPQRPLVFMDIAVPRDVDEDVAGVPNVRLYDIDTLSSQLETSLSERAAEIPRVEAILDEERSEYFEYLSSLDVVPTIVEIRKRADSIRQAEFEKSLRRMDGLSEDAQKHIEALTKSIVNKILHEPTNSLKEQANGSDPLEYARIARSLFGLD